MLDLRYPMGMMFALVGTLLAAYGVATNSSGMEPASDAHPAGIYLAHSLGLNVNLWWGLVLLCFGLLMLCVAHFSAGKQTDSDKPNR